MTLIALSGQPNTGKSTVFNRLTGARQKVANFPGVTVEKKEGFFHVDGKICQVVDLPGLYSLDPSSFDEHIASSFVLGTLPEVPVPECVAVVVNSSLLERGLYLISQLQDLEMPVVVILNMMDTVEKLGRRIDLEKLSGILGVPVVGTVASKGMGIESLKKILVSEARPVRIRKAVVRLPKHVKQVVETIAKIINHLRPDLPNRDYWAKRVVADYSRYGKLETEKFPFPIQDKGLQATLLRQQDTIKESWKIMAHQRYEWARNVTQAVSTPIPVSPKRSPQALTQMIDRVVLHPVAGPVVFLLVMGALFQSIFTWAVPLMDAIDIVVQWMGQGLMRLVPEGLLQSFLVDGVVAGVGNVLIFVPQIMILFGMLTVLEDSGYLSRASFLLDRLLVKTGLSGKAFIPLLSSFACAIPGIMAARHIDDRKERLMTIMVAPLMTCSARLPVYALLISAFVPAITLKGIFNLQGLVFLSLYVLGVLGAAVAASVMKRVWMRRSQSFYVTELPLYRWPQWKTVVGVMLQRGKIFVFKAGKIILFCTMVLWFLASFPRNQQMRDTLKAQGWSEGAIQAEVLKHSYIGQLGKVIEPGLRPLGFDWKIGIGLLSSFAAREVVVSTMGTLYSMSDVDETSVSLKEAMRKDRTPDGQPVFTLAVALSLLVFYVFAMQCMSTLAVTRRETQSWMIPWVMFIYMLLMAYGASYLTYTTASLFV